MRGKNWLAVLVRVVCLVILMVACVAEVYGSSTGIQSQTPKKSQSDDISDSNQSGLISLKTQKNLQPLGSPKS